MRKRNNWVLLHKKDLVKTWGDRCLLCLPNAEKQKVEWHHLQHFVDGGDDSIENIVPLCHKHHMLIHHSPDRENAYKAFNAGGRPPIELDEDVIWQYLRTEIARRELNKKLGLAKSTKISDLRGYKRFVMRNGIKSVTRVRNKSTILYTDGRIEHYEKGEKLNG